MKREVGAAARTDGLTPKALPADADKKWLAQTTANLSPVE